MLRNFSSPKDVYRIRAPKNFYAAMRDDVELLLQNKRYLALTTVIMCCVDALAADSGDADRGKFERFMKKHFPDLCTLLDPKKRAQVGKRKPATRAKWRSSTRVHAFVCAHSD